MGNCKTSNSTAITAPSTISSNPRMLGVGGREGREGRLPGGREGRLLSPPVATCRPATCRRLLPPFHSAIPHSIPHSRRLELIVFRKFLWCQQRAILELSAAPPQHLRSTSSPPPLLLIFPLLILLLSSSLLLFYSSLPPPLLPKILLSFFSLFLKKNRLNSFCFHFLLFTSPLPFTLALLILPGA